MTGNQTHIHGKLALTLYYVVRRGESSPTCTAENIAAAFPFTRYAFAEAELERLCEDLAGMGFLAPCRPEGWRIIRPITSLELSEAAREYLHAAAPEVLRRIPLEAFGHFGESVRDDPMLAAFAFDRTLAGDRWWDSVTAFSSSYNATVEDASPLSTFAHEIYGLAELQEAEVGEPGVVDQRWQRQGLAFLGIQIPEITPWKSLDAVFYFVNARKLDGTVRASLEADRDKRLMRNPAALHILVPLGQPGAAADALLKTLPGFAFLWPGDLRDIVVASKSAERFRDIIKSQIDLELISPYQTVSPVSGDFFYGRTEEIALILAHPETNYAIYGGRRIGKTSLLKRLATLLNQDTETPARYVDCEVLGTERDFCSALCQAMELRSVDSVVAMVSEAERAKRRWVLLLDEVDWYMKAEALEFVLRGLRALANSGCVRLILAGFRVLRALYRDRNTGMHNLAEPITLGGLGPAAALGLATRPMAALGLDYAGGTEMVETAASLAGYHPSLIQRMCAGLVALMSERKESVITEAHIREVFEGKKFREFVDDLFFKGLTPVEQLIVLTFPLRTSFAERFVLDKIAQVCPFVSQDEVFEALTSLELAFVMDKEGKSYRYCYEHFPTILRHNHDIDHLLAQLVAEEKRKRHASSAEATGEADRT